MTAVVGRSGRVLRVRGLDLFDGIPVLDLKPYTPDRAVRDPKAPEWHNRLLARARIRRV
jgi:tRNA (Thr-GGU) A37 N-methylase